MTKAIIKNFIALAGAETISKLLVFISFAYLARVLGPTGFGIVEWSFAVLICATMIVEQGLSSYGAREIARSPEQSGKLIADIILLRAGFAVVSYLILTVFAFVAVQDTTVTTLILIYGLSLLPMPFLLTWVLQGHKRMGLVALVQLTRYVIFAGITFWNVHSVQDLNVVAWAEVAAVTAAVVLSLIFCRRLLSLAVERGMKEHNALQVIREALPIGLSHLFWVLRYFGATMVVGLLATAEETGYFGAAMRILIALHTFVWLYFFNLLPSLAETWQQAHSEFSRLVSRSLRLVLPVSIVAGIVWVAGAEFAMSTSFGAGFVQGATVLQLLSGVCIAAAISGHYRFGLIAAGFQRQEMTAAAVGTVVMAALVPIGYLTTGLPGAAAGLVTAELVVLAVCWWFAKKLLFEPANVPLPSATIFPDEAAPIVR